MTETRRFAWSCLIGGGLMGAILLMGSLTSCDTFGVLLVPGTVIAVGGVHGDYPMVWFVTGGLVQLLVFGCAVWMLWFGYLHLRGNLRKRSDGGASLQN